MSGAPMGSYSAISSIETCLRSLPSRENFTLPSRRANRVSSLPLPTPADQNVAGQHELAVAPLHAQTLGVGVTAVLGGAAALFVGEELKTNTNHDNGPSFLRFLDGED